LSWYHYFADGRIYRSVIIQISLDRHHWITVFNNDQQNVFQQGKGTDVEYIETDQGKTVCLNDEKPLKEDDKEGDDNNKEKKMKKKIQARYIRHWSKGNNKNDWNHVVEIRAFDENGFVLSSLFFVLS
jgi:hypothetical protein